MFGTDGIRGVPNESPLTPQEVLKLACALAQYFQEIFPCFPPVVVMARDTRLSGTMLQAALTAGFLASGWQVEDLGVLPTPAVASLVVERRAVLGVVISASHNPWQHNGIKLFGPEGEKLSPEREKAIVEVYEQASLSFSPTVGQGVNLEAWAKEAYILKLLQPFASLALRGKKILLDCAHGATWQVAPEVFRRLGAEVIAIGVHPDGKNINEGVGALHPERLGELVKQYDGWVGFAFDGDGDRVMAVDEQGVLRDGDYLLGLLAAHYRRRERLSPPKVVATVMSNLGLEQFLRERGIELIRTGVGDRKVYEEMKRSGALLGGEQSGHLLLRHYSTTGDGILSALAVCAVLVETQTSLSELCSGLVRYPQLLRNVEVKSKPPLEDIEELQNLLRDFEAHFQGRARHLLRYSGTEPLLRIMLEGEREEELQPWLEKLEEVVRRQLS